MTAKAKRRIIMGIASGCGRACERPALAPRRLRASRAHSFSRDPATRREAAGQEPSSPASAPSPEAIAAEPDRLAEIEGMSAGAISEFKIVEAAAQRFAKGAVKKRLPMGSWTEVIDYCRTSMAFEGREIFRILFLDKNSRVAFATVRVCPLGG